MKILEKVSVTKSFDWVNWEDRSQSDAFKAELFIDDGILEVDDDYSLILIDKLISFFKLLNVSTNDEIVIRQFMPDADWWGLPMDAWGIGSDQDVFDFEFNIDGDKSEETITYWTILKKSNIDMKYTGFCKCNNWDKFLSVILNGVVSHIFPYSPHFYNFKENFLLYFHHSYEIGIYYKNPDFINMIKRIADRTGLSIQWYGYLKE